MMIKEISLETKTIPLRTPFITALRRVENVEFVRVSVVSNEGVISYGESPATKAITGEDIPSITRAIDSNKELFYGLAPNVALEVLHKLSVGSSAKACLDMAFYALNDDDMRSHAEYWNEKRLK